MKVKLKERKTEVGGSLNKRLLFIGNYYQIPNRTPKILQ